MDRHSLKLSGFCHSCSLIRPLDKIFFAHTYLHEQDPDETMSRAEFFQKVDAHKKIESHNFLRDDNFKHRWVKKETPVTRTFVEWKTMETSMEDGLLGRAAVSRTSAEHMPWEIPKTPADSSHNFFSQYDSFNYGSREDYKRRLRKASMIKEIKAATSMKCSASDLFVAISNISSHQNQNRRDWNGELFDCDPTLIQDAMEYRQTEERDREVTNASSIATLDFRGLELTTKETSNIVKISLVESSVADDLTKKYRNETSFLPCEESEAELINSGIEAEEQYRRRHRRFPPPLLSLRKTSSLLPHKVPLLLLQPIRRKDRLILQEVQVTSQMVFQHIRKDGRLQLRLFRNLNKSTEQNNSSSKSSDVGLMTAELTPNLEMNLVMGITNVGDNGEQSEQIYQNEKTESFSSTERILAEDLALRETESISLTAEVSAGDFKSVPSIAEVSAEDFAQEETESVPSTAEVSAEDFESVSSTAEVSAEYFPQKETESVQTTEEKSTERSALAETKPAQEVLSNFKFQKLESGHLGVLQTMQQILFQTIQHHYDQDYQNELIKSFVARELKLSLCKEALINAEQNSTTDYTNLPDIVSRLRVNSVDIQCVSNCEASFKSELDPNDSNLRLSQILHMLDTPDQSMQLCRYKDNRRRADEGLNAMWEAHCIAT